MSRTNELLNQHATIKQHAAKAVLYADLHIAVQSSQQVLKAQGPESKLQDHFNEPH